VSAHDRQPRLLLVSTVFPPLVAGGAPRLGEFARRLPDHGWDVTVLTAYHTASAIDHVAASAIQARATIVETWSPAAAVPRGIPTPRRGVFAVSRKLARTAMASILFPDRDVMWVPGAIAGGRRVLAKTRHDAVLATYGPASALIVGRALARMARLPLVVDFRDLWSTLPMPVFPTPMHRWAARRLEQDIVRSASRVIAVSQGMVDELVATHDLDGLDAVAITNGFDPDDARRVVDKRGGPPRPFRLVYSGSVHAHYDLGPLWRAIRALADAEQIRPETFRIEFVGNLALSDARAAGVDAFVEARPFVPHADIFDTFAHADALLVVETPGYYARNGYAAKVFDYLLTGKPVLALVETAGNTYRLLRDAGVGRMVPPGDHEQLRTALAELVSSKGAKPRAIDCDQPPLRVFNRHHLVGKLARVLDDVVATEPRGRW
jgi:glycosyltransferase involved in cell wall biosynthesis